MGFQVTLAPTSSHQPTQGWFCCSGGCDSWERRGKYPLRQEEHQQLPPQGPGSCLTSLPSHSPQGRSSSHELWTLQTPRPNTDTPVGSQTSQCPGLSSGVSQASPTALHTWHLFHTLNSPLWSLRLCLQALPWDPNPSWVSLVRQQQCQLQDILQNSKKKKKKRKHRIVR